MSATRLQALQWTACETVNQIVECDEESFEARHRVIQRVREHLEARAEQTKPDEDFSDLLGTPT
jgi:hypothetical protein